MWFFVEKRVITYDWHQNKWIVEFSPRQHRQYVVKDFGFVQIVDNSFNARQGIRLDLE